MNGMPKHASQRDDGSSYVANMTHNHHIDINGETTVQFTNTVADDTVIMASTTVAASETYEVNLTMSENFGRTVVVESTDAGDVTIVGYDYLGQVVTETITCIVGDSDGAKAFKRIVELRTAADLAGDIVLKTGDEYGLPFCAVELVREIVDGAASTEGAITLPDTNAPTATTGDVRGTYNPNTAGDGNKDISITYVTTADLDGGLYGQAQV